jgi:hypothetical protein
VEDVLGAAAVVATAVSADPLTIVTLETASLPSGVAFDPEPDEHPASTSAAAPIDAARSPTVGR